MQNNEKSRILLAYAITILKLYNYFFEKTGNGYRYFLARSKHTTTMIMAAAAQPVNTT